MRFARALAGSCALVLLAGAAIAKPSGTPSASYTAEQASAGRLDYYESCAECHGGKLEGVFGPALAGGDDNLQYQAVADVYTYMSTHMPHGNPTGLPQEQYVAIMAFLMQSHGLPSGAKPLTVRSIATDTTLMGNGR